MKEVEIQCPCCDSQLLIDVLTQKVLRATPRRELDSSGRPKLDAKDWDAAFGKVSGRLDESVSKFDASLDRERKRTRDLDDLFAEAEERVRKRSDGEEDAPSGDAEAGDDR